MPGIKQNKLNEIQDFQYHKTMSEDLEVYESKHDIIMSNLFADYDLCELSTEVACDVIFYNNPSYVKKALVSSDITTLIWNILSNEAFEKHPIRLHFANRGVKFEKKYWIKEIAENFKLIPGAGFYELRHDEKRSTLFFEFNFFSAIAQLRQLHESAIDSWAMIIWTSVGSVSLV